MSSAENFTRSANKQKVFLTTSEFLNAIIKKNASVILNFGKPLYREKGNLGFRKGVRKPKEGYILIFKSLP